MLERIPQGDPDPAHGEELTELVRDFFVPLGKNGAPGFCVEFVLVLHPELTGNIQLLNGLISAAAAYFAVQEAENLLE